jgi:hypothetical protein
VQTQWFFFLENQQVVTAQQVELLGRDLNLLLLPGAAIALPPQGHSCRSVVEL